MDISKSVLFVTLYLELDIGVFSNLAAKPVNNNLDVAVMIIRQGILMTQ
jgi:hypothetical protein